ncbi:MAG: ATPase, F1 complex, delta/epsilon subunit [Proteiniphilum sp. 51_7]|nr:MAG: ATPase, F1 complex, delta/epsilon subunit [Proteiniphilum sp. 51_7]
MQLEILTPERTFYSGEVNSITLPGTLGSFQILNNHAPLISSLTRGKLSFSAGGRIREMEVTDGFVEVNHNKVTVCIDSIKGL